MKKLLLLVVLVGSVLMLQAQKLEKTAVVIEKLKGTDNPDVIQGLGSDEDNYYVYRGIMGSGSAFVEGSFFVINKKLTTVKEFPLIKEKDDRFLWVQAADEDLIILLARDKKGEQRTQIIKQAYSKSTGKLKKETVIASFQKSKSDNWYFYSSTSPDKTKNCFLFMLATKKKSVDSYYAAVLNQNCEVEFDDTHDLEVSNESFGVGDIAVTNNGNMYIAFYSCPSTNSANKNNYIDLIQLTNASKDKTNLRVEEGNSEREIQLKALKNNDIYLAGIFSRGFDRIFYSVKINGSNLNFSEIHKQIFIGENIVELKNGNLLTNDMETTASMSIIDVLELNNGNVAVLLERSQTSVYESGCFKNCWAITTVFAKGSDASIENFSVMKKRQSIRSKYIRTSYQSLHLSIFPFVYGDKASYLFNDCLKRFATPSKYRTDHYFRKASGDDASIALSVQESGEKNQLTALTGNSLPAKRLVREILFQENDKLIVLTRNNKEAYIETITLP